MLSAEQARYSDISDSARKDVIENRNFAAGQMRGKGLSAGQQQSYSSQLGAQANRQMERINSLENNRYQQIQLANMQNRSQANQYNTAASERYDIADAQNRAVQDRYLDEAAKEVSSMAERDLLNKYARARDNKAFKRDIEIAKNMQEGSFKNKTAFGGAQYIPSGRYTMNNKN